MSRKLRSRQGRLWVAFLGWAALLAVPGGAQAPPSEEPAKAGEEKPAEPPTVKEEITVTATLREEKISDVPFSIAAPSGETLQERGASDIEGIAQTVPGFIVQNLGPGQSQIAMRGVSSGQIVRDQPGVKEQVGVYLDDSVISASLFTPDLDLFDIDRVEVLRGPQGTLFGAGSESGTVRYITRQPELKVASTYAELGLLSPSGGDLGGTAKVAVNTPLGDTTAMRLAAYYNDLGGSIDAVQPDLSTKRDVNGSRRTGARWALRFAPNERLSITPRIVYQDVKADGINRIDVYNILANPFTTTRPAVRLGEREQFTQIDEPFTDKYWLTDLNLGYTLGSGARLTSITSYTDRDILQVRDAGALTASITGGSLGLPENVYTLDAPLDDATKLRTWTEEVRLSGTTGRLAWLAGAFYSKIKRDYAQSLLVSGFEDLTGIPTRGLRAPKDVLFFSDLHYDLRQYALFSEETWKVNDNLDLTAGLRYYNFKEDRGQIFDGLFANDNNGTVLVSQPGKTDANGIVPRLIASFAVSPGTRVNAQVSRGFRLGGINDPLNVPLCTPQDLVTFSGHDTWKDEKAWNYEIGAKSTVMGGRGSVNVAGFYTDIDDLQATVTAGSCSSRVIFNVPKARSQGFEIEIAATPDSHWDYALSASYTDSELGSTLTSTDAQGHVAVVSGIEKGNRLPTVPKLQAAAAVTYQWQARGNWLGSVTATYQHVGARFTQIGDQVAGFGTVNLTSFPQTLGGPLTQSIFQFNPELPAYDLGNLRAALTNGRWNLALYVNNVTDERAFLSLDQERGTRARVGFLTNPPRTVGLTAGIHF